MCVNNQEEGGGESYFLYIFTFQFAQTVWLVYALPIAHTLNPFQAEKFGRDALFCFKFSE